MDAAGNVIQMEHHAVDMPADLGLGDSYVLRWGTVKIGDAIHLLPISLDWTWITPTGDTWHVTASFKNHRHFESATNIRFD